MSVRRMVAVAVVFLCAGRSQDLLANPPLTNSSRALFADAATGRELLTASDDFVERMSPFDRAARLKTDQAVSHAEYLDVVGSQVVDWHEDETARLETAIEAIRPRLAELGAPLPETVFLICTTGQEEGGAFYTRGAAIVFPRQRLAATRGRELERVLSHELFHVLSRVNPALKDELYATIGFVPCGEVELPGELAERRITNPDAPRNDHAIKLTIDGQQRWAVPILYANAPTYDVERGGEFFRYLEFQFLVAELDADGQATPVLVDGEPLLASPHEVEGFFEQVGRNTQYILHPEEILADNFALLVLGSENVASPDVLERLTTALQSARPGRARHDGDP